MFKTIKRKLLAIKNYISYREYDKIYSSLLGGKISLFTSTLRPQRYKYIMLAPHGTGRTAFWFFLKTCGAYPMREFDMVCINKLAFFSWRKIYGIVCDRSLYHIPDACIFISKLKKKVPVFILVRDPISSVKGLINLYAMGQFNTDNGGGYNKKSAK